MIAQLFGPQANEAEMGFCLFTKRVREKDLKIPFFKEMRLIKVLNGDEDDDEMIMQCLVIVG